MPSRIGRKTYWIVIAVLLTLKVAGVIALDTWPQHLSIFKAIENGWIIALALTIGFRFSDFGFSKWLGVILTLLITIAVPLILFLSGPLPSAKPANPLDILPDWIGYLTTGLLVALIVFAGVRRSVPGDGEGPPDSSRKDRREPSWP